MDLSQVAAAEQIRYKKPIRIIKEVLKKIEIDPLTDIFIHPLYPYGFEATVGIDNSTAYVFFCNIKNGTINLREEEWVGFLPSGVLETASQCPLDSCSTLIDPREISEFPLSL